MPISSGANGWPNSYFSKAPPKQAPPKVIVVENNPGYSPEASPLPQKRLPSPEVMRYEEHVDVYEGGPDNVNIRDEYRHSSRDSEGGPGSTKATTVTSRSSGPLKGPPNDYYMYGSEGYGRYGQDGRLVSGQDGKYVRYNNQDSRGSSGGYWRTGPDGKRVWVSSSSHSGSYDSYGRQVQGDGNKTCCFFGGNDYYTTGVAGAGAGCCAGGMFGSRRYPYSPEQYYTMKGNGRKRCCACLLGLLLALLLLGLLLGMLLGVKSYVDRRNRQNTVSNTLTGGYYLDGVYYYPITNPPDVFYFAMGPLIPCNKYNNNSDIPLPTGRIESVTEDATATAPVTIAITDPDVVTVPDCQDITTQYILAQNYTPAPTPVPVVIATTADPNQAGHVTSLSLTLALLAAMLHVVLRYLQKHANVM